MKAKFKLCLFFVLTLSTSCQKEEKKNSVSYSINDNISNQKTTNSNVNESNNNNSIQVEEVSNATNEDEIIYSPSDITRPKNAKTFDTSVEYSLVDENKKQ